MNSSALGTIILGVVFSIIILAVINGIVLSLFDGLAGKRDGASLSEQDWSPTAPPTRRGNSA